MNVELHKRRVRLKGRRTATYYTLRWYGTAGKRHSESLGRMTWSEAKDKRRAKEANLAGGTELVDRPERLTVAGLVEYHRQAKGPDLRPRTRLEYEYSATHIKAAIGADKRIDKINGADIGRLKTYLLDTRKVRDGTVTKVLSQLRAMLNLAVRERLIPRNPLDGHKLRPPEPKAARVYTKTEARALVAAAPTAWWRAFLKLAYTSGLRAGELLTLRWADVDLDAGLVHVRPKDAGTFDVDGETYPLLAWTAKSRRAYRTVPIPQDTAAVLKSHRDESDGAPYVFLTLDRLRRIGRKMDAGALKPDAKLCNNVLRDFRVIHKAAKLPDPVGTVHDLRKSYGTMMAGVVPMPTLQAYMGHANVSTTAAFYCRERQEDATAARAAMADETPDLRLVG